MKLVVLFLVALGLVSLWGWSRRGDVETLRRQREEIRSMGVMLALSSLAGLLAGLARRERVTAGEGYSSPLRAWLGKRLSLAGLLVLVSWICAPLSLAAGLLWASAAAVALGARLYFGNLPGRL